jgi:hypothetical protein
VHRFSSYLKSHVHFPVLATDAVFSAGTNGEAMFHPALDLAQTDFTAIQAKMRRRGLRWLQRHGPLDDEAVHALDSADHAGGWSVDVSVIIPGWDRQGLERLARYCTRPPLSQERFGRPNDELLVYNLRRPTADGRTELLLTPEELMDRLAQLVIPPRIHKHRYCGVLAPNARLCQAVVVSARPVIERILARFGEPTRLPAVLPARSPPQGEFRFDQTAGVGQPGSEPVSRSHLR